MNSSTVDYSIIGNRIKSRRNELKITQEELANELGMTSFYLSKIENGHAHPTLDTLSVIANQLDIELSILIAGISTLDKTNYVKQLHDICFKASNKQLKLIIKLAKSVLEEL